MRYKVLILLTAIALSGATSANAKSSAGEGTTDAAREARAAAPAAKPAKQVCKVVDRIGSNVRERICLSKSDWARVDKYLEETF